MTFTSLFETSCCFTSVKIREFLHFDLKLTLEKCHVDLQSTFDFYRLSPRNRHTADWESNFEFRLQWTSWCLGAENGAISCHQEWLQVSIAISKWLKFATVQSLTASDFRSVFGTVLEMAICGFANRRGNSLGWLFFARNHSKSCLLSRWCCILASNFRRYYSGVLAGALQFLSCICF